MTTDLSPDDKNPAGPGDAGAPVPVPTEQAGGLAVDEVHAIALDSAPPAEGVELERAERWAIYDLVALRYVNGSLRVRPPTPLMVKRLAELNEDAGGRFELRRV